MSGGESELGNKWRLKIKVGEKRREDGEEEGILKKSERREADESKIVENEGLKDKKYRET